MATGRAEILVAAGEAGLRRHAELAGACGAQGERLEGLGLENQAFREFLRDAQAALPELTRRSAAFRGDLEAAEFEVFQKFRHLRPGGRGSFYSSVEGELQRRERRSRGSTATGSSTKASATPPRPDAVGAGESQEGEEGGCALAAELEHLAGEVRGLLAEIAAADELAAATGGVELLAAEREDLRAGDAREAAERLAEIETLTDSLVLDEEALEAAEEAAEAVRLARGVADEADRAHRESGAHAAQARLQHLNAQREAQALRDTLAQRRDRVRVLRGRVGWRPASAPPGKPRPRQGHLLSRAQVGVEKVMRAGNLDLVLQAVEELERQTREQRQRDEALQAAFAQHWEAVLAEMKGYLARRMGDVLRQQRREQAEFDAWVEAGGGLRARRRTRGPGSYLEQLADSYRQNVYRTGGDGLKLSQAVFSPDPARSSRGTASRAEPYSLLDPAPGHGVAAPYLPDLEPKLRECHLHLPAGLARAQLAHRHFNERRQRKLEEVGVMRELEHRRRAEFLNYRAWFNLRGRPAFLQLAGRSPQRGGASPQTPPGRGRRVPPHRAPQSPGAPSGNRGGGGEDGPEQRWGPGRPPPPPPPPRLPQSPIFAPGARQPRAGRLEAVKAQSTWTLDEGLAQNVPGKPRENSGGRGCPGSWGCPGRRGRGGCPGAGAGAGSRPGPCRRSPGAGAGARTRRTGCWRRPPPPRRRRGRRAASRSCGGQRWLPGSLAAVSTMPPGSSF